MRSWLRCLGAVFLLLLVLATEAGYAQQYPFYNLNVDDGLVQSQATCITQDRTGNLWIGTLGGLSRYDGHSFTNYKVRNGLLGNTIWSVAADTRDNIWIGTAAGITCFNGRSFRHFLRPKQTVRNISNNQQLYVVHDTVWWRVQGEVYFIADGRLQSFQHSSEKGDISVMLAREDGVWFARQGRLYHSRGALLDSMDIPATKAVAVPAAFRLVKGLAGNIWVVANTGVFKVTTAGLQDVSTGVLPAGTPLVISLTEDKNGVLWLGTNGGVVRLENGAAKLYSKKNGLRDNPFLDMFTDASGNVWMASDGQGIFRFSGARFTVLNEASGLPSSQVTAFESLGPDSLLAGTYEAGLFLVTGNTVVPFGGLMPAAVSITTLCKAHDGRLWIGTRGRGLWCYERGHARQLDAPVFGLPSNFVNTIHEDAAGRLWIGFANGAVLMENDKFTTLPVKNQTVVSFLFAGPDSTLIATDKNIGLTLYHAGQMTPFHMGGIADSSTIQCFLKQGRYLWMGSSDNGVMRYDMASRALLVINENTGLRSDFVYNIVEGQGGDIWVGTGFGIHRIRMPEQAGQGSTPPEPEITFYGKADGVTGMESNINAALKLPDGSIWFGTTNGAFHYRPNGTLLSSSPISIVLQSVKLTGEAGIPDNYYDSVDNWYAVPHNLRLPSRKNNITFTFQAIAPAGAGQCMYRYRLDGLETPWSDWSLANTATYSALPPGRYKLVVQCKGADDAAVKELKYPFEIITPFHKTGWFRILVIVGAVLLGIVLQYMVHRARQQRRKLLARLRAEEQDKVRATTAEDFHDEIGNKLTRINVLTNVLKNKIPADADTARIIVQIQDNTNQLYSGTRDILWSLKPSNDTLYEILVRIQHFGMELFQDTEVTYSFTGIEDDWRQYRLPMDVSRNLIMIFKEALNNSLKYAKARNVVMKASVAGDTLDIILTDDGIGFDIDRVQRGNGLNNMNVRAGRLKGHLSIQPEAGFGTTLKLTMKIPLNR